MTLNGVANLLVVGSVPQETTLDFCSRGSIAQGLPREIRTFHLGGKLPKTEDVKG